MVLSIKQKPLTKGVLGRFKELMALNETNITSKKRRGSNIKVIVQKKDKNTPEIPVSLSKKVNMRLKNIMPPPPWALRIHKEIFKILRSEIDMETVSNRYLYAAIKKNLAWLSDRAWYHKALIKKGLRNNLDGSKTPVSKKHMAYSKKRLATIRKNKK